MITLGTSSWILASSLQIISIHCTYLVAVARVEIILQLLIIVITTTGIMYGMYTCDMLVCYITQGERRSPVAPSSATAWCSLMATEPGWSCPASTMPSKASIAVTTSSTSPQVSPITALITSLPRPGWVSRGSPTASSSSSAPATRSPAK